MLKIDFDTLPETLLQMKKWDIVSIAGKELCITKWTMSYPTIQLTKTSKSKGRGLTRDGKIMMSFDTDASKVMNGDSKCYRLHAIEGVDCDGNKWFIYKNVPSHEFVNTGSEDPWTVYVDAYRKADCTSTYGRHLQAAEVVSRKFPHVRAIKNAFTIERVNASSLESRIHAITELLTSMDWTSNAHMHEVIEFFKKSKGIDVNQILKHVKETNDSNRAIERYAEKHPSEFV